MRILFMGSAELACPCLDRLLSSTADTVVGVITQPDRPKGIPLLTPDNVNAPDSVAALRALAPDLVVVVAYGQFLKPDILALPPLGCINVHASLLPKYRGAAPIQWAIAGGSAARPGSCRRSVGESGLQGAEAGGSHRTGPFVGQRAGYVVDVAGCTYYPERWCDI